MATKRNFTNGFLDLEEENKIEQSENEQVNDDDNKVEKINENINPPIEQIQTQTQTVINTIPKEITTIQNEIPISKYVEIQLEEAEKNINIFYGKQSGFGAKMKKPKFSEMYAGITISMNRDLDKIIEYLTKNSTFTKTQLLEMLIVNGLKSTNFE